MARSEGDDAVTADVAARAELDANSAAASAGVRVQLIESVDGIGVMRGLMKEIWGPQVVPPANLARGLALAGAPLLVASMDGAPVGFALGFVGWTPRLHLHSHQVGVLPSVRRRGVAYALKLSQRSLCLQNDIQEMRWTFDPVLATNARFNFLRLGCTASRFLPSCYGVREDLLNLGDDTDRLEVVWKLDQQVGPIHRSVVEGAPRLIESKHGIRRSLHCPAPGSVIPVPATYHQLRAKDPHLAKAWRKAMRDALLDVTVAGLGIDGFSSAGYVVGNHSPLAA